MSTKRELILQAIKAKLTGIPGVANANVFRSRVIPFSRDLSPAVVVEPVQDLAQSVVIPFVDWELSVKIMVIVRGDIPDQIADPIVEYIDGKVLEDLSLGGLCMDISPNSVQYEIEEADKPLGLISLSYSVRYRAD